MTQIDLSPVDWTKPIEAVHEDGRVLCLDVVHAGPLYTEIEPPFFVDGYKFYSFSTNTGTHPYVKGWRIRNRQESQSTDPKLVERALKLVEDLAAAPCGLMARKKCEAAWEEAKAIATLIKEPKTDEEWAKQIAAQEGPCYDFDLVLRGIAKGRELQRENPS